MEDVKNLHFFHISVFQSVVVYSFSISQVLTSTEGELNVSGL